ncbi:MAG: MiaB/RimO family radical SAM methylthiotransferase [Candidatus Korobacteraceae bacterium]
MGTFFVENFGCRATQADGAAIERDLLQKGLTRAEATAQAEFVVLNTCTVTTSADHDARATIRRIHRENPQAKIIVTGCYAQRAPEEIASIPGVSLVVGNSHKPLLAEFAMERDTTRRRNAFVPLSALYGQAEIIVGDIFAHTELIAAPVFEADTASEKTRPNLKVQDGCNNRCSFCIIPFVRGRSRSLKLEEVLASVRQLVAGGYREIVLSGINLGRWGRDLAPRQTQAGSPANGDFPVAGMELTPAPKERLRFADLLRAILQGTTVEKIRISSVEPMDWSDDLIELVAGSPRICKHAHVPLQSASDRLLRAMHRRYRPWHYADRLRKIRQAMPQAAIGADVMVGFPGESDGDFEQTRMFIEALPFTYLHVFTYSSRPGTVSAAMPGQVRGGTAHERNRILRELAARKKREFQQGLIGGVLQAITLTHVENGRTEALTDNYQKLWLAGVHPSNQALRARILGIEGEALMGRVEEVEET